MTDTVANFALMISGSNVVQNVVVASSGTTIPGFTLQAIASDVCCNPGSYYNSADGKFYADSAFTTLTGLGENVSSDTPGTDKTTYTGVSDLAAVMQDTATESTATSSATSD